MKDLLIKASLRLPALRRIYFDAPNETNKKLIMIYSVLISAPNKDHLQYLVEYLDVSDASVTASSERNADCTAKRVKTYRYVDYPCAWAAARDDPAPWVQFDMQQEVAVWGILVMTGCYDSSVTDERVTTLQVAMSQKGVKWNDASGVITTNYSVGQMSVSWFAEVLTAQYWRIYLLSWVSRPSMKADLLGQPTGKYLFSFL